MVTDRRRLKLIDCQLHGIQSESELFIVEGDSAARAVERLRNPQCQAVLPIQGKPLNAIKANEASVRRNPFLAAVFDAVGTDIGEAFSIQSSRYHRILILCDPDADGIHAATLLLLFFYRWMKPLVAEQRIFMVRPPCMLLIDPTGHGARPIFSEDEATLTLRELDPSGKAGWRKERFRGLASLPADLLRSTCLEPTSRRTDAMSIADAEVCLRMLIPS